MSAIELNARASSHFAEKLAETKALLQRADKEFSPITQASWTSGNTSPEKTSLCLLFITRTNAKWWIAAVC